MKNIRRRWTGGIEIGAIIGAGLFPFPVVLQQTRRALPLLFLLWLQAWVAHLQDYVMQNLHQ
jgi:hypothetical protein